MQREEIRNRLIGLFSQVAPEIEEIDVEDDVNLQDQLDLDSVDMMNYIVKVQEDFSKEIPNSAYNNFMTINGAIAYLMA